MYTHINTNKTCLFFVVIDLNRKKQTNKSKTKPTNDKNNENKLDESLISTVEIRQRKKTNQFVLRSNIMNYYNALRDKRKKIRVKVRHWLDRLMKHR